ncbi:MAG: cation:proton antiporter [Deltaproteobacteria bacterium]
MRRILVLAGLLGLMTALSALRAETGGGAADPMTLAAIGFVVLAAFTVGEMMTVIKLPRITGYILSGILLGPQASKILTTTIVGDMRVFNTLALGLIATTAGLELDIKAIKKVGRTLSAMVALKIPLLLLLVGGTFYGVETFFPFLGVEDGNMIIGLAVIVAVLGIGTSPAIALAVINESGAKGRLSDITLAISVVKDLVVVLALAVSIAIVRTLVEPGATMSAASFLLLAREIGVSLVFGGALGVVLILYLRFVHRDMLLAIVVCVLLSAEAIAYLHAELLLVFITAGFVVRNFSKFEHELLEPLVKVSLPVFVVFFTTAGAGVDLFGTYKILPLALALTVARILAFVIAGFLGARIGNEDRAVGVNAWMAFTPQAGVTLGLVLLAEKALPVLQDPLHRTGLALVAINLVIGPVLMGLAFKRAGEVGAPEKEEAPEAAPESDAPAPAPTDRPDPSRLDAPELVEIVRRLDDTLRGRFEALIEGQLQPLADRGRKASIRLFVEPGASKSGAPVHVAEALEQDLDDVAEGLEKELLAVVEDLQTALGAVDTAVTVPMSAALLIRRPHDRRRTRVARWWRRNFPALAGRTRTVPTRMIARIAIEARLCEALLDAREKWFATQLRLVWQARQHVIGAITADECRQAIDLITAAFLDDVRRDLIDAVDRGMHATIDAYGLVGSPGVPASALRLSAVEPIGRAALERLEGDATRWREVVDAAFDTLRAAAAVERVRDAFVAIVKKRVRVPLDVVETDLLPIAATLKSRLEVLLESLEGDEPAPRAEIEAAAEELYPKRERNRFTGLRDKYRHATQASDLLAELSELVELAPKSLELIEPDTIPDVRRIEIRKSSVANRIEGLLIESFAPQMLDVVRDVSDIVVQGETRLDEAMGAASFGLDNAGNDAGKTTDDATWRAIVKESTTRSRDRLDQYVRELTEAQEVASKELDTLAEETCHDLEALVTSDGTPPRPRGRQPTRRTVADAVDRVRRSLQRARRRVANAAIAIVRGRQVRDWLIRSGQRRLDASQMRQYLDRFVPDPAALSLPPIHQKVFSLEPIEDLRLAVAYKPQLEQLIKWIQPGRTEQFANVLVIGDHGSGRTSVVNALELRLARHRVLRIDPRFHSRRGGLVRAIARELRTNPDPRSISVALRRKTTIILIDDIEHYVLPTTAGLDDLSKFLQTVMSTSAFTHWVASTSTSALALLEEMAPLSAAFGRRFTLAPLSVQEVREVLEARTSLSGFTAEHEQRRFLGRAWRPQKAADDYYRAVTRVSGGNLRAALLAHVRSIKVNGDTTLLLEPPSQTSIPFGEQIPVDALAVLGLLVRFGPLSQVEVAEVLGVPADEAGGALLPLEDAGLVLRTRRGGRVAIPAHMSKQISTVLERQGVVS